MGEPEEQQQLQNWKIKIIFLCRRELYEPLHPGEYNWISSLVGSLGTKEEWELGYVPGVQTMCTTWQAAREKINFLPNNRSSRPRPASSSLVSGCCAKILFRNEMKISSAQNRGEHCRRGAGERVHVQKSLETNAARN